MDIPGLGRGDDGGRMTRISGGGERARPAVANDRNTGTQHHTTK